jgi:hypothetical protein
MVPLVVHKYNNEDVLLSFLDISRKIYVTLSPNKPVTLESGQVFVWKNGTVYQVVEDYPFKNKDDSRINLESEVLDRRYTGYSQSGNISVNVLQYQL